MTSTPIKPNNNQKIFLEPLTAEKKDRAIAMLDEWANTKGKNAQEQHKTGKYLKKTLDEERISINARTLFS